MEVNVSVTAGCALAKQVPEWMVPWPCQGFDKQFSDDGNHAQL